MAIAHDIPTDADIPVRRTRRPRTFRRASVTVPARSPSLLPELRSLARSTLSEQALRDVLDVIAASRDLPTAYDINRALRQRQPRAALGSTYRALNALAEAGYLRCHDFGDGVARFEAAHAEPHDHLIDVESGTIERFSSEELRARLTALAASLGFRLMTYRLILHVERRSAGERADGPVDGGPDA